MTADGLLQSAIVLFKSGEMAAAEVACRQAIEVAHGHSAAMALLGVILQSASRFAEAENVFDALSRGEPQEPSHWVNLATARRGLRRFDDAIAAYTRAVALGERSADLLYNVGTTHLDRLDYDSALGILDQARTLAPRDAQIRVQYARACDLLQRTKEGVDALTDWRALDGLTGDLLAQIAQLLHSLGERGHADAALQESLSCGDRSYVGSLTLVGVLERVNRLAEARSLLQQVSAGNRSRSIDNDIMAASARLAQRSGDHGTACRLYREAMAMQPEFSWRHFDLFPLAQSLDKLGQYEEAYSSLLDAHDSQAAYLKLAAPLATLRGPPTMVITNFGCDLEDVRAWGNGGAPPPADSPIFIVAFPRSGTTLLELALDAHPRVKCMDEQPFIQNALDEMVEIGVDYPRKLSELSENHLQSIRERYLIRARGRAGLQPGDRLLDKNPLNILRLPVIGRLFPNARIVAVIRHPCDVLLSCFMQHFRAPDFALLCQSLPTLAKGYARTFAFWYAQANLLATNVYELRYETLVARFEDEMRTLCDFLELPWDPAVLEPRLNALRKGYISTPSYAAVIEPISSHAVGRWKHYEQQFAEVMPFLDPYLKRWKYNR